MDEDLRSTQCRRLRQGEVHRHAEQIFWDKLSDPVSLYGIVVPSRKRTRIWYQECCIAGPPLWLSSRARKLLENKPGQNRSGKCLSPFQSIHSRQANNVPHYNYHETTSNMPFMTRPCQADLPGTRIQIGSMLIPTFSELPVCPSFAAVEENSDRYLEARKSLLLSMETSFPQRTVTDGSTWDNNIIPVTVSRTNGVLSQYNWSFDLGAISPIC